MINYRTVGRVLQMIKTNGCVLSLLIQKVLQEKHSKLEHKLLILYVYCNVYNPSCAIILRIREHHLDFI